jgi:hypothetical protein
MTKIKGLILIIIILLVSNMIAWFMLFDKKHNRTDRKANAREFLQKEVGFTNDQLASFDSLSDSFSELARGEMTKAREKKAVVMKEIAVNNFSDSAITNGSREIAEAQQNLEYLMLKQAADIRLLCTPAQLPKFDEGWVKMYRNRKKNSRKK